MEQDEMKLAWKELNEKITASTFANKETLAYILKTRRMTAWQRLVRADKSASIFLFLFAIGMIYYSVFVNNGALWVRVQVVILLLVASGLNIISYLKLTKMKLDESVPVLYKQVSSYKKLTVWSYLICYVLVFILVVSLLLVYPLPHFSKVLIFLIIPVGVAIDCFIFHWSSNHIHTLVDTTKELKELNKLE
ncbi:hypothetical protein D0T51_01955 [Parabacteroides sp. 52]|uniref:hypothetical protein n=1 Tax=unclassified Parabacteroides TaxID=2649774 RepID=UPI0013D6C705|nr:MULTISPECIES: hypothetical protein [unclassified Parabacteroides]MDH6533749.1 membrane protein YdbS with pleckstrin-like domain [Parabacteroides sp. PM5-20]NDV54500.1 hypothetical protein [Parabacteroides sp. 52]